MLFFLVIDIQLLHRQLHLRKEQLIGGINIKTIYFALALSLISGVAKADTAQYTDSDWNLTFAPAGRYFNKNPEYVTFHQENGDKFMRITHVPGDTTGSTKSDLKNGRERSEVRTLRANGLLKDSEYSLSLKVRFKTFVDGKIYFMQVHNNDKEACPKQLVPIKVKLIDDMNTIYISPRNVQPYYADAKGMIQVDEWNDIQMDFTTYDEGVINFYLNRVHIAKDVPMTVTQKCARMKVKVGVYKEFIQDEDNRNERNVVDYDDIVLKKIK